MSTWIVVADANVLIPRTLRDYVVYLGKAGAYDLHWSQSILDEVSRNLIAKYGFTQWDAEELEMRLTEYLPWALVEPTKNDELVTTGVDMDDKDRHVLAAALAADATVIVTDNDRHFPRRQWMTEHGIDLWHAADLPIKVAEMSPAALRWAHCLTVANSPKTEDAILATLELAVGKSAVEAVRQAATS